jgi:hypothetical protein
LFSQVKASWKRWRCSAIRGGSIPIEMEMDLVGAESKAPEAD